MDSNLGSFGVSQPPYHIPQAWLFLWRSGPDPPGGGRASSPAAGWEPVSNLASSSIDPLKRRICNGLAGWGRGYPGSKPGCSSQQLFFMAAIGWTLPPPVEGGSSKKALHPMLTYQTGSGSRSVPPDPDPGMDIMISRKRDGFNPFECAARSLCISPLPPPTASPAPPPPRGRAPGAVWEVIRMLKLEREADLLIGTKEHGLSVEQVKRYVPPPSCRADVPRRALRRRAIGPP